MLKLVEEREPRLLVDDALVYKSKKKKSQSARALADTQRKPRPLTVPVRVGDDDVARAELREELLHELERRVVLHRERRAVHVAAEVVRVLPSSTEPVSASDETDAESGPPCPARGSVGWNEIFSSGSSATMPVRGPSASVSKRAEVKGGAH